MLSPLQADWKAIRKMLPGLYHDGNAKAKRMQWLQRANPFILEADYSNYDRNIPVDLFAEIVSILTESSKDKVYWRQLTSFLHEDVSVIWPDYVAGQTNRGWLFKAPLLGLLSGLKITSEEGTFVNLIITIQSAISAGILTEGSAYTYLTRLISDENNVEGELFFIQSDDNALIHSDLKTLLKFGESFKRHADVVGSPGSLSLGDRFLMRHISLGRDTPNATRVFQNTLSNEDSVIDPTKFLVGLVTRTEGLLGQRTFDPFQIKRYIPIHRYVLDYEMSILKSLHHFLSTASYPHPMGVSYLTTMLEAGREMTSRCGKEFDSAVTMNHSYGTKLDEIRVQAMKDLAAAQLKMSTKDPEAGFRAWIDQLMKDKHIPSSSIILDQIIASSPAIANYVKQRSDREHKFYEFAMSELKIPRYYE